MNQSDVREMCSPLSFTLRHLLASMVLIAIPLGLFRTYWIQVNDTQDERTVPFSDIAFSVQVYLYAALGSLALIVAGFILWLCLRKNYVLSVVMMGMVALCSYLAVPLVRSKIVNPVQGNPVAHTHSNAASIVAMSVLRYFDRKARWPDAWDKLDQDISDVLSELNAAHEQRKNDPDPFARERSADPYWGEEASQSLSAQAPDVSEITPSTLRKLVDMDFTADPKDLALQKWYEFKGIIPKKPSYNFYRVEFKKLIGQLSLEASAKNSSIQKDK
jgi:drug/metabolite transporter superfamily protein YnfA